MIAGNHIFLNVTEEIENAESDDDDLEKVVSIEIIRRIRGKQKTPARIRGYVENVIPRYTNQQFRHFRMLPEVFEMLENRLGRLLYDSEALRRPAIPVRTQLLSTIWFLGTPDSFRYTIFLG